MARFVIKAFRDLQDNKKLYEEKQVYAGPRENELHEKGFLGDIVKEEMTVKEIKAELEEKGIDYPSKATKAELIELLGE